jgi:hypothetical protein
VIESRTTRSFRTSFAALPEEIQAQGRVALIVSSVLIPLTPAFDSRR